MKYILILLLMCSLSRFNPFVLEGMVNEYRATQELKPLIENNHTCWIATKRVQEVQTDWSHKGFYKYASKYIPMGENLSEGYSSEQGILNAWLASPTHKANIERHYKFGCIRCMNDYCAHTFSS